MKIKILVLLPLLLQLTLFSHSAHALNIWGALGKTAMKKVFRQEALNSVKQSAKPSVKEILRRDLDRDALSVAKPLAKPHTVYRYTGKTQAAKETQLGISSGKHGIHTTSVTSPGRPLSAEAAQKRYGLPDKPQVRETILLPQGVPVKKNKALGGEAGYGEFNLSKPVPKGAIRKITPLQ